MQDCKVNEMISRLVSLCILILIPLHAIVFAESLSIEELLQKGKELMDTNQDQEALQYFDRVIEIDQKNIDALNAKGVLLGKLGRYQEALQYFDRVIEIDQKNVAALSNKGVALIQLERNQDALQYLDEALKIDPKNENALNNKAVAINKIPRKPIQDSKYLVYVQIQIRNSIGQLVGYLESDNITYLDYKTTYEFVNSKPVKNTVTINDQNYDLIEFFGMKTAKGGDDFVSTANIFTNDTNITEILFSTTHDGYILGGGDTVTALWSILKPSS